MLFRSDEAQCDAVLSGEWGQEFFGKIGEESGIHVLAAFCNGMRCFTTTKTPLTTVDSAKGITFRVMQSEVCEKMVSAIGANPVPMAGSEMYTALQNGTVDGQENPLAIILTAKVYEVQKYITMIDLFYSPCVLMINEDIYNNFTDEQKEAFDKAAEDGKVAERQISQELASSARATMEAEGVVFTDVNKDEWVAAVQSVYDDASLKIDQDLLAKIKAETAK